MDDGDDRRQRDPDWMWNANPPVGQERALNKLIRSGRARSMPRKSAMHRAGPHALLEGWLPAEPIIHRDTRVIAMGSCFAALFTQWLAENGFNSHLGREDDDGLLRSPLESPAAVAQQFRWAFGELDPDLAMWFGTGGERVEPSDRSRDELRSTFESTEVAIITLGLAETWFDTETGEPLWRVPPFLDESGRFEPRVTGVDDCLDALETIDRLRREHMPKAKIVYTVSPVRFRATFRPMSPLVANSASKAIIRASIDEFVRRHAEEVGKTYFYFPSFEIIREFFVDPYSDNIHIRPSHSDVVIDTFARSYTTLPVPDEPLAFDVEGDAEFRANFRKLEEANDELKAACDERAAVIEELKATCDERLALIERLDAELNARAKA